MFYYGSIVYADLARKWHMMNTYEGVMQVTAETFPWTTEQSGRLLTNMGLTKRSRLLL